MRARPKVCTEGKVLYRWIPRAPSDAARNNSKPGQSGTAGQQQKTLTMVPAKLEQMVKKFKTHRCAMDFDHSFCKAVYNET